jgi:hypothetical protein
MAVISCRRSSIDRFALVQLIRRIFARSPIFREPVISEPFMGRNGEVAVHLSFDHGPALVRVVAPSEDEAYTVLYEFASTMVEVEANQYAL